MEDKIRELIAGWQKACERKQHWEPHWQECYNYAFPQRENVCSSLEIDNYGSKQNLHLFDGTAPDAVDQLASSLLSELTPPWAKWFGLKAGADLSPTEKSHVATVLEKSTEILQQNFEHSNFAVEIHQCYLDLVTAGTACLMFEEAPLGESTAFRFYAVPLREIALEESADGKLDRTFRCSQITPEGIRTRFPVADLPEKYFVRSKQDKNYQLKLIEAVLPRSGKYGALGYEYTAFAFDDAEGAEQAVILHDGIFDTSPFINFRWLKAPGEVYGRSPVMKALPDIKTANKVVELVLKNASIAVTGIW